MFITDLNPSKTPTQEIHLQFKKGSRYGGAEAEDFSVSGSFDDETYFKAGVGSYLCFHVGIVRNGKRADIELRLHGRHLNDPKSESETVERLRQFVRELQKLDLFSKSAEPDEKVLEDQQSVPLTV